MDRWPPRFESQSLIQIVCATLAIAMMSQAAEQSLVTQ
jgi:hypothetical protein